MASKVSKYTIVVAVLEGRHFPRRSGASVYVQCKFNGEQLSTDPVTIGNLGAPMWDTELAWDLDARALHYLRTNRVPIKVSVYALSPQGSRRALLGNLVLDLRAAQPFPAKEIWAPLIPPPAAEASSASWLSTTTNGPRPELKISFGSGPQGSDMASAPSSFPRPISPPGMLPSHHASPQKPGTGANNSIIHAPPPAPRHISSIAASSPLVSLQIAQQPDGAYRVGTDSAPDRMFRLAITLVSICDLTLLAVLPSQQSQSGIPSSPSKGYFVLMQLLGNELRTQSFTDPKSPSFPEETLTMDLVVGSSDIETLIRSLDKLPVHLCYDDQILGVARVDLLHLFLNNESQVAPASHECSLDVIEDSTVDLKISQRPKLALRVALTELPTPQQLDSLMNPTAPNPATIIQGPKVHDGEELQRPGSPAHLLSAIEHALSAPTSPHLAGKSTQPPNALPVLPELPSVPIHVPSTITALRKEYEQDHALPAQDPRSSADPTSTLAPAPIVNNLSNVPPATSQSSGTNNRWHQYRFSIDIKAARDLQPPWHSANVFFKYAYGPFGTRSPFLSHPPISLSRNSAPTEVLLTSGFCAYEFVMAPSRLRLFLDALPLEIFAVHKDVMAKDTVLGAALVDLGRVMDAAKRNTTTKAGQPLEVQVVDHWANVCASAPSGSVVKVLAIRVTLCLEDFGPIEEQHVPVAASAGAIGLGPTGAAAGESVDVFANSITIPPSVTVGEEAFAAGGNKVPRYPPSTAAATPATPFLLDPTTVPPPQASTDPTAAALMLQHQQQQQQQERLLWERAQQQVEEWRQRQEQRIEQAIRERDATAMKELESRLKSRESELDRKAAEYREVELHLERLLADMERREQALQREEQDLIDRKVEMEREFEARCAKVEDTARRLDADVVDQRERDRARLADLERQRNEAVAEKAEWERKFRALDQAFFEFKSKAAEDVRGAPEARDLQVQLKEAKDKLDAADKRAAVYKKQRTHFKQQWLKTLAEYAQFKRDAEQAKLAAESEFHKRLAEAQALHGGARTKRAASPHPAPVLPNVAVPGKSEVGGAPRAEAEELQRIRAELNELRETHEQFKQSILGATIHSATGPAQHHPQPRPGGSVGRAYVAEPADGRASRSHSVHGSQVPPPHASLPRDQLVQLERIIQERDLLLRSGVYTVNDHLIREMNARIQQLEMS